MGKPLKFKSGAHGKAEKDKPSEDFLGGPQFTKTLGQHILKNPLVVNSIVEKVRVRTHAARMASLAHSRASNHQTRCSRSAPERAT